MNIYSVFSVSFMLLASLSSNAQMVKEAAVALEPNQLMADGRLTACGSHITMINPEPGSVFFAVFVYTFKDMTTKTLFNAGRQTTTPPIRLVTAGKVQTAWIRFNADDPIPILRKLPTSDESMFVEMDSPAMTSSLVLAVESGARVQVGIRLGLSTQEIIYSGKLSVDETKKQIFRECHQEVISRILSPQPK